MGRHRSPRELAAAQVGHATMSTETSFALPTGQTLTIQSENTAKASSEALARASQEMRKAGPDLGGWTVRSGTGRRLWHTRSDCALSRQGGKVWDSAEVLALLLVEWGEQLVAGRRVLELGCGCGLVGLVAAALGPAEVVLTDQVLFMAQANLDANYPSGPERDRTSVRRLVWGEEADVAAVGSPFDLIVGSDIIYHGEDHLTLAETLAALSGEGTTVLFVTPDGSGGGAALGAPFFFECRRLGFDVEDVTQAEAVARAIRAVDPLNGEDFNPFSFTRGPMACLRMTMRRAGSKRGDARL